MTSLKLITALMIVALGQGNFLAINHQKLKPLPGADSKKVSSANIGKQAVSKLPSPKNGVQKIYLLKPSKNKIGQNQWIIWLLEIFMKM